VPSRLCSPVWKPIHGDDHLWTLITASNLAFDLRQLGDIEAARDMDAETLARRRRILGDDDPQTLDSASNLATDLERLGEHQAAAELRSEIRQRRSGQGESKTSGR
jgi:hypothetical protein